MQPSPGQDNPCLVQLKIAGDAPRLLGFAKYVWTIPVQVVQIHLAFSSTGITVSSGCSPWRVRSSVISRVQAPSMNLIQRLHPAQQSITPTGIVVNCQNEKSQLQNKVSAMRVLQAKLLERKRLEERAELDALKGDGGSSWGDQMRSYVLHPYQMVEGPAHRLRGRQSGGGTGRRHRRVPRSGNPVAQQTR